MRKAVSPMISTLIMLAIVATIGGSIMLSSSKSINTFTLSQGLFLKQGSESIKERLVVEFVKFNSTAPKSVNVYIGNVGHNDINIDTISIVELSTASFTSVFHSQDMQVQYDPRCTINVEPSLVERGCWKNFIFEFNFNTGQVYKITVMTITGSKVMVHATA